MTAPAKSTAERPIEWVSLWQRHQTIHPRWFWGRHVAMRWLMVALTQCLFYGLPWLTWNDRPFLLFDLVERRFYVWAWVFYPQDLIYLALLLVICALGLFLFTTVAGRVWCGFACPQTVYSELFRGIERLVEGDRTARLRLETQQWSWRWCTRKSAKHLVWLLLAAWTGLTFVGYFTPLRTLLDSMLSWRAGGWESFWVGFYGLATYGNAGFMREQVCKFMCPYARFQSAMFDRDSLIVSYDRQRGEPRGPRGRQDDFLAKGLGSCVDCSLCVQVCPTGIDIRDGLQYECISCGVCVDACNHMMDKLRYPRGLIQFTSERALQDRQVKVRFWWSLLRPRVLVYSLVLYVLVAGVTLALLLRPDFRVDVVRDRASLYRLADNGAIENVYRLQLMNNTESVLHVRIEAEGLPGARVMESTVWQLEPAQSRWVVVHVQADESLSPGSHPMTLLITRRGGSHPSNEAGPFDHGTRREQTVFLMPR